MMLSLHHALSLKEVILEPRQPKVGLPNPNKHTIHHMKPQANSFQCLEPGSQA